ncbi:DUF4127 family protein [Thermanaeromonas sp. C210]|uniref:DUF4127 family protein n=1 Tax=Thermanaeromonas sp. C210 TaxID=2731925 RepID=UPI00155BDEF3|nr:DUF4127 family protein [Thermanaeromonas sp. C210]GFN22094.1 hypothetical protein TAMC210_04100 [Thermanaeromonas sp. C210]
MGKYLIPVLLFITLAYVAWSAREDPASGIIYIPVDERPLNLAYVEEVAEVAGIELHVPPRRLLPDYKTPADVEALWSWALDQKGTAAVLSADTLIYGGLIPSRRHQISQDELVKRAERFRQYREAHPDQKLYVFVTLMRTPNSDSAASEPDYYARYGKRLFRLSALEDKESTVGLTPAEREDLARLRRLIPADVYSDWVGRREKNLAVTRKLVEMVREGVIDLLILCRDDTATFSRSRQEYRQLSEAGRDLPSDKFISFPGTDEVGLLLVARAALEGAGKNIYVTYAPGAGAATVARYEDVPVGQNISAHIKALGCREVTDLAVADLALVVNTPRNGITGEAAYQDGRGDPDTTAALTAEIQEILAKGIPVALADVAYANGADVGLLESLRKEGLLFKLTSYAGMNTAGNAIGYALAQGLLLPGKEGAERVLLTRYLDDWGYQAGVRQAVRPLNLKGEALRERITADLTNFARRLKVGPVSLSVDIFWDQTFNIGLKVEP